MQRQQLKPELAANLTELDSMFGASSDYYAKKICIAQVQAAVVLFDNLASLQTLCSLLLTNAGRPRAVNGLPQKARSGTELYEALMLRTDLPAEPEPVVSFSAAAERLTAGFALLLIDGSARAIAFSVQNMKARSVSEPSAEGNIRGSREGFTELLRTNLSLLRRLIRTENLVSETAFCENQTHTEYAVCYDRCCANAAMIRTVKTRLAAAVPQVLLDSSYFVPWLCPARLRFFAPVGYTERPAVAAAKICEGKAVVLVNGSPSALIVPYLFEEHFSCLDDYAGTAYFASVLRILKYVSFLLTVMLPGAFVCTAVYLPELLPPAFLYKISAAERATPLPLFAEMLLVILILEIIREAGLRMPDALGNSVSLVAALIVGDAAISAGVLSTPVILIGAVTSIAMFVTPQLYEPASVLRVIFLLAAGFAGPAGFIGALLFFLLALAEPEFCGVPYTLTLFPVKASFFRDGIFRRNLRELSASPYRIRQAKRGRR